MWWWRSQPALPHPADSAHPNPSSSAPPPPASPLLPAPSTSSPGAAQSPLKRSEQIAAVLGQRRRQQQAMEWEGDRRSSSGSSTASFETAREGGSAPSSASAPALRLVSPSGRSYSPSIPSTAAFTEPPSAAAARARPSQTPAPVPVAAPGPPVSAPPAAAPPDLLARLKLKRAAALAQQDDRLPPRPAAASHVAVRPEHETIPAVNPVLSQEVPPPSPHPSNLDSPTEPHPRPLSRRTSEYRPDEAPEPDGMGWAIGAEQEGDWGGREGTDWETRPGFDPAGHSPEGPLFHSSRSPHSAVPDDPYSPHRQPHVYDPSSSFTPPFDAAEAFAAPSSSNSSPRSYPHLDHFPPYDPALSAAPVFDPSLDEQQHPHPHYPSTQHPASSPPQTLEPGQPARRPWASSPTLPSRQKARSRAKISPSTRDEDLWASRAEREKREREKKLEWERARREEVRRARDAEDDERDAVSGDQRGFDGDEKTPSMRTSSSRTSSARSDSVLAQGALLLPPSRFSSDPFLHAPSLWRPHRSTLTSRDLQVSPFQSHDSSFQAFRITDVSRARRLETHDEGGFFPFVVELRKSEKLFYAALSEDEADHWVSTLNSASKKGARPSATRASTRSSRSTARSSPSTTSSSSSSTRATSPEIPFARSAELDAHLSKLHDIISNYETGVQHLSEQPTSSSPSKQYRRPTSDSWMGRFNKDVPTYAVLEELPHDAGPDVWSAEEARQPVKEKVPRPRPDSSSSSFAPQDYLLHPPHPVFRHPPPHHLRTDAVLALQSLLDRLKAHKAEANARRAAPEASIQLAQRELNRLKEELQTSALEDGGLSEADQALLDRIDWLLHLNQTRAKKHHRAASMDGSVSGLAQPSSMQEDRLVEQIQSEIDRLLNAAYEAERSMPSAMEEWEGRDERGEVQDYPEQHADYPQTASSSTAHIHNPSGGVFSPVPFDYPVQQPFLEPTWRFTGVGANAPSPDETGRARTVVATPALTSRFSPNTSEHVSPDRRPRPTHDYGEPGYPLPPEPLHSQHQPDPAPSNVHPVFDMPNYPEDAFYPHRHQPSPQKKPSSPEDRKRHLVQLLHELETRFYHQSELLLASDEQQRGVIDGIQRLSKHLAQTSHDHSAHLDALFFAVKAIDKQLRKLPSVSSPSHGGLQHSRSFSASHAPPPYPHVHLFDSGADPHHHTRKYHRSNSRDPGEGGVPRVKLQLTPGNGRMGPRVGPAEEVPRNVRGGGKKGTKIYGVDAASVPPEFHSHRWAATASGARAAKELDALVAHHSSSALPPPLSKKGKAKGKAKVDKVVDEMMRSEAVQRALEQWRVEEMLKEKKTEVDPAAKAFSVYEILYAAREAKKREEEAEKAAKKGKSLAKPAAHANSTSKDDPLAHLAHLLSSTSLPPERLLPALAAELDRRKLPASSAPKSWKDAEETKRALVGLMKEREELDNLYRQQTKLKQDLAEQLKEKSSARY